MKEGNIRTGPTDKGGGPLYDIGIYCINAARYLFRDEPTEVVALAAARSAIDPFVETDEQVRAVPPIPGRSARHLHGQLRRGRRGNATIWSGPRAPCGSTPLTNTPCRWSWRRGSAKRCQKRRFGKRDQIAPELEHLAGCVLRNEEPEPSGWEGLHDVRIIRAILESASRGRKVSVDLPDKRDRPGRQQASERPPVQRSPSLVNADPPSDGG